MILAILAIWFGYKRAKATGRNPFLWAAICGGTFIGVQWIVAIALTVLIGVGVEGFGWSETLYDDLSWLIYLLAIVASIICLLLLFRFLDKVPQEPVADAPPPPPAFDREA